MQLKSTGKNVDFMNQESAFLSDFTLRELLDLTEEVFFIFRPQDNKLLFLNAVFEKVFNITREAAYSNLSLLPALLHPEDLPYATDSFSVLKKNQQKQNIELRMQLSDDKIKWIRVKAYMAHKDDIDIIAGTATDITADKEYSNNLHKYSDKKNSILQILSHDLLGPLGNIQALTYMLSEHVKDNQDTTITEFLDLINKSNARGLTIIRELVNKEFLQSIEVPVIKQRVDLIKKLQVVFDQFKQSPHVTQQKFHLITSVNSLFVTIDSSKFIQVITNLLSNSLKFTPDDGNITITVEDEGNTVLIEVQDSGIGIPEELKPFLFDKFTQAGRPGIKGEPSTGLGMSIIKTIVEWHKGQIWFESSEGKGTAFYIRIPKEG